MRFHRLPGLVLVASLVSLSSACVVHTEGGFSFLQGGETAERRETLALEVAAGETLDVELVYGDISVRAMEGEAARVDAHWKANAPDQATAEAVLERYKLELVREHGTLRVRTVGTPLDSKRGLLTQRLAPGVSLVMTVPPGVRMNAKSGSGEISARGALGSCSLSSSYGDVSAEGTRGDASLSSSSGKVEVSDIQGESVVLTSQYGDVSAEKVQANTVRLKTSSGDVSARDVAGKVELHSSYGSLSLRQVGGDIEGTTSSGDIDAEFEGSAQRKLVTSYGSIRVRGGSGSLEAKTSSGDVDIDRAGGSLSAASSYGDVSARGVWQQVDANSSSGAVEIFAEAGSTAAQPWKIITSYGDVRLEIPADMNCEINARASSGDVECDFGTASDSERKSLRRTVGTGGNTLDLKSGSGDVQIRKHSQSKGPI